VRKIILVMLLFLGLTFFNERFVMDVYAEKINYEKWENILNTYVDDNGKVNYEGLKIKRVDLDAFIEEQIENAVLSDLSKNEQKAFWINAYNVLTMRLIVDHYSSKFKGIRSIKWGRPWDIKMKAAGRQLTLGEIEHQILRKWEPIDPRIHFAINCASIGCPKMANTHFDPGELDKQLDREAEKFMKDAEKVKLDRLKNILYHSAILNWFEEDFLVDYPDKLTFILQYLDSETKQYILEYKEQIRLKEMNYDWSLNRQ
jgi:Protein of unknown function, DUF547